MTLLLGQLLTSSKESVPAGRGGLKGYIQRAG